MFEEQAAKISDRDHVRNWIGVLSVGEWLDYGAPLSALMNLSEFARSSAFRRFQRRKNRRKAELRASVVISRLASR